MMNPVVKEKNVKIELKGKFTEDRRKAQRLKIPLPVKFRMLGKKGVYRETSCQNISGGGLMVCMDLALNKGDRLEMLLHFPGDPRPVELVTEVMWSKKKRGEHYAKPLINYGMRYVKMNSENKERFILLFCEMMIEYCMSGKNMANE